MRDTGAAGPRARPSSDLARLLAALEDRILPRRVEAARRVGAGELGGGAPALASALEEDLYPLFARRRRPATPADPVAERWHLARLSRANRGSGTWEPGWRIHRVEADGFAVERHGVIFRAGAGDVRCRAGAAVAGGSCRVRIPAELRALLPGFVVIWGDADVAEPGTVPWLVRCYWHLRPAAAPRWVDALTSGLDELAIPFSLKVLSDPRSYRRADAGVLFLEPDHFAAARPAIRRCWRAVRADLRPAVPRLTARLAPGLAVAEGPADGGSFGQHRCRLIAGAVARAVVAGRRSAAERRAAVIAAFHAAGLDPRRPHLGPGSTTAYRPL